MVKETNVGYPTSWPSIHQISYYILFVHKENLISGKASTALKDDKVDDAFL